MDPPRLLQRVGVNFSGALDGKISLLDMNSISFPSQLSFTVSTIFGAIASTRVEADSRRTSYFVQIAFLVARRERISTATEQTTVTSDLMQLLETKCGQVVGV